MRKQFNYTRPMTMYIGYGVSILMFIGIIGVIPMEKMTIPVFLMAISFLLLFFLLEKFAFQKNQVTLLEEEIEVKKAFGKKVIKYNEIYSVEKDSFSSNLIIRSGHNGKSKCLISAMRISKKDISAIEDALSKWVKE